MSVFFLCSIFRFGISFLRVILVAYQTDHEMLNFKRVFQIIIFRIADAELLENCGIKKELQCCLIKYVRKEPASYKSSSPGL